MDEQALAKQIAAQVLRETQLWVALIAAAAALAGVGFTVIGNGWLYRLKNRTLSRLDASRKKILKDMLELQDWRKLSTLSRVIGADAETTKQLLIDVEARGSEKSQPGEEVWRLISKNPLDKIKIDSSL